MTDREQRAVDLVRDAWSDAVAESPSAARARDLRAAARFAESARRGRSRSFGFGLAGGLAVAAIVAVVLGRRELPPPSPATVTVVAPPGTLPSPSPSMAAPPPAPVVAAPAPVIRSCNGCKKKEEAIEVPTGSKMLLSFSLDASFAEPEKGVTIEGPARARTDERGVLLLEGRARVDASKDARVRTAVLETTSDDARYTIEVDGDVSRVFVMSGHVKVTMPSGETRVLGAGERATTQDAAIVVTAAAPPPVGQEPKVEAKAEPKKSPDEHWSAAKTALESGDRGRAESELRGLVGSADGTHPLYPRASFRLAELELARGATIEARPRLAALLSSTDAQLAEDAATLYARSYPTPAERAVAWSAYLATNPPPDRRERAMLERIRSLVAAGRATEARAETTALCATPSAACTTARDAVSRLP
jgi:hypothetical protein